ncbi:hypothetical protein ABPG75_002162 [Micractinium tetrahymenae]
MPPQKPAQPPQHLPPPPESWAQLFRSLHAALAAPCSDPTDVEWLIDVAGGSDFAELLAGAGGPIAVCSDLKSLAALLPPLCSSIQARLAALPAAARQAPDSFANPEVAPLEQLTLAACLLSRLFSAAFSEHGHGPALAQLRPTLASACTAMLPAAAAVLAAGRTQPLPLCSSA